MSHEISPEEISFPSSDDKQEETGSNDSRQEGQSEEKKTEKLGRRDFLKKASQALAFGVAGNMARSNRAEADVHFFGEDDRLKNAAVTGEYQGIKFNCTLEPSPPQIRQKSYGQVYVQFDIKPEQVTRKDNFTIIMGLKNPSKRIKYVVPGEEFYNFMQTQIRRVGTNSAKDLAFYIERDLFLLIEPPEQRMRQTLAPGMPILRITVAPDR